MTNQNSGTTGRITDYNGHFALYDKGKSWSRALRGEVCILAFLVHDENSTWTINDIEKCKTILNRVVDDLHRQSALTRSQLHITYDMKIVSVPLKFDRDLPRALEQSVLRQYGRFFRATDYRTYYEKEHAKDDAPVVFMLNREFRSFAIVGSDSDPKGSQASYVSCERPADRCARTLTHELLHQYGAIDFYLPAKVSAVTRKYFPNSVMSSGIIIDPLTRFLIGWDQAPREHVLRFLEETKTITMEDIWEAYRKDSKNDW